MTTANNTPAQEDLIAQRVLRLAGVARAMVALQQLGFTTSEGSFLSMTDGASWDLQATPAVDVPPGAGGNNHPASEAGGQTVNNAALMRSTAADPADLEQDPA